MTNAKITTTWVLAIALSGAMLAHAKTPPNSFLRYSANSQSQLVQQIKKYPEVSDRYERHYAMTQAEVIQYVKNLKLAKLETAGDFVIYNVPPRSGILRSRVLHLPKGTKVWVDWQGEFTLQWVCGNPMTRGPRISTTSGEVVADIVGAPAEELAAVGIAEPGDADGPLFASNVEPYVSPFSAPAPVNPGALIPVGTSGSPLGLLFVPLLFLRPGDDTPDTVVPEPGTMLAMGVGVVTLLVGRRRLRSRA